MGKSRAPPASVGEPEIENLDPNRFARSIFVFSGWEQANYQNEELLSLTCRILWS
jgi:hypothetical protein